MSPPFKIIARNRSLRTGVKLPVTVAAPDKPKTQRWKRGRGKGNLVAVAFSAPGVARVERKPGKYDYYWCADRSAKGQEAVRKGFQPPRVRLHGSAHEMEDRAEQLQKQVDLYCSNNLPTADVRYAGTISSLIKLYRNSPESGYFGLKYNVARTYDNFLDRLDRTQGRRRVHALTKKDFFYMHQEYLRPDDPDDENANPRLSKAHRCMQTLRMLFNFGVGLDDHCERMVLILRSMRFEQPAPRKKYLTLDHVVAFIDAANLMGLPSMALAQAIMYETGIRQRDCIGEWWPDDRRPNTRSKLSAASGIAPSKRDMFRAAQGLPPIKSESWMSGLVWEAHISPELVMVKPTSKSSFKKMAMADFKLCPLVMKEIIKIPLDIRTGPVIIDEKRGTPYTAATFRRRWREIAERAGIPADHFNMDTRAGAVTEGSEAGVDIELLRQFATHASQAMTQHYNRETLKKARIVHRSRNASRAQPDESRFDQGAIIDADWSRT